MKFLVHLQRRESDALGFIPYEGLEKRVEAGRVLVALENGEPAAFAMFDVVGRTATVHQTAAMVDARRRGLALRLSDAVRASAGRRGAAVVKLACGDDLAEALSFWEAAGFREFATLPGGRHRRRTLKLLECSTIRPVQLELGIQLPSIVRADNRLNEALYRRRGVNGTHVSSWPEVLFLPGRGITVF